MSVGAVTCVASTRVPANVTFTDAACSPLFLASPRVTPGRGCSRQSVSSENIVAGRDSPPSQSRKGARREVRRGAGTSRRASREDVVEARAGEPVRVGRYAPRVVAVVVARPEPEVLLVASAAACTTARASSIDVNARRGVISALMERTPAHDSYAMCAGDVCRGRAGWRAGAPTCDGD